MKRLQRRHLLLASAGAAIGAHAQSQPQSQPQSQAPNEITLEAAGSRITLQWEEAFPASLHAALRAWVQTAADTVVGYLGRFPVPQVVLLVRGVPGAGVKGGTTFADPEPFVRLRLGLATQPAQFADDWVLVHEMVHLAIPRVPRSQNWLHEGIATYVEGVARVRAGLNTPERLWAELVRGLPQGQPQAGDSGLDHTPTWGRTYWGGAMFCLQADVALLRATHLRAGLRQALQGVQAAGGSYAVAWPVLRILETADKALGVHSLVDLYMAQKDSAEAVDLAALWRDLGVTVAATGTAATLDNAAPWAAVRRAIA